MINALVKSQEKDEFPNELSVGDTYIRGSKSIANGFNKYFCNIGTEMALKIKRPVQSFHQFSSFNLIEEKKIASFISSLKGQVQPWI